MGRHVARQQSAVASTDSTGPASMYDPFSAGASSPPQAQDTGTVLPPPPPHVGTFLEPPLVGAPISRLGQKEAAAPQPFKPRRRSSQWSDVPPLEAHSKAVEAKAAPQQGLDGRKADKPPPWQLPPGLPSNGPQRGGLSGLFPPHMQVALDKQMQAASKAGSNGLSRPGESPDVQVEDVPAPPQIVQQHKEIPRPAPPIGPPPHLAQAAQARVPWGGAQALPWHHAVPSWPRAPPVPPPAPPPAPPSALVQLAGGKHHAQQPRAHGWPPVQAPPPLPRLSSMETSTLPAGSFPC